VRRALPRPGLLAAWTAAALATSCSQAQVDFSETTSRNFLPSDYERVLERWTRDEQLFILDGLDNALTVTATFKSWEYRQAWRDRYANDFRLDPEDRLQLAEAQRREMETAHEFYVAATSSKRDWCDLASEDSPWLIRLFNDRDETLAPFPQDHVPPGIEEVERPTPVERAYFPYVNEFRRVYRLRFPRQLPDGSSFLRPNVQAFTLEFAGALGRAELRWSSTGD
jgi:hypothetical protein